MIYSHTRSHEPEKQERRYWDEDSTPLFPFGHGLSYGQFAYSDLAVDRPSSRTADRDRVGRGHQHSRPGSRRGGPALPPPAARHGVPAGTGAQGFQRITLAPGNPARFRSPLGPDELPYWNAATRDWVSDASTFDVWVGGDSASGLTTTFEVTAVS